MTSYSLNYDQEVDILYITFSPGEKPTAAVELNNHILLRFNRDERRAVGLTLMDFSVLVQTTELGPRNFPLAGLDLLEPEWRDVVIQIISSPPVDQILKISAFSPSITELIPVAFVEKDAVRVAM